MPGILSHTHEGGFEQHRPAEQSGGEKSPCGAFLDARLAQSTRAHQKTSTYTSTLRFLFCNKARLIERVDSNSCGAVAEDSAKTAQWAVFSSAACDIHPRPPKKAQRMNGRKRGRSLRKKKKARQSSTDQRAILVGAAGFEPTASSSRTRRATNCAMPRKYRSFSAAVWLGMRESNSHK